MKKEAKGVYYYMNKEIKGFDNWNEEIKKIEEPKDLIIGIKKEIKGHYN